MGDKFKPWHSRHRIPKHKRPKHRRGILPEHFDHEDRPDRIWITLPPTEDELDKS